MCIVHLMCVFHYFMIFSSFTVCIFRGVKKLRPRQLEAPECRGPLCTAQPAQTIATPLDSGDIDGFMLSEEMQMLKPTIPEL